MICALVVPLCGARVCYPQGDTMLFCNPANAAGWAQAVQEANPGFQVKAVEYEGPRAAPHRWRVDQDLRLHAID